MKHDTLKFLVIASVFVLNFGQSAFSQTKTVDESTIFWTELQRLCGKAFAGTVVAAPEDDTTFKGKELVMHVRACEKNRI